MEICDKFLCVNRKNKECHVPKNIVAFTCKHTNAPCPKARCEYCDVKECEKQYDGRIDRMSMISEQVKEIKACAYAHEASGDAIYGTANSLYQAADTIEALSAKLQAANMERSERYYNGGWILCEDRLPEEGVKVLVWFEYVRYGEYNRLFQTIGISYTYNGQWSGFVNDSSGWDKLSILAWQPLPEPYHEP